MNAATVINEKNTEQNTDQLQKKIYHSVEIT